MDRFRFPQTQTHLGLSWLDHLAIFRHRADVSNMQAKSSSR